ncbi:MAG: MFS transporter [Pseudomonadales bacterium]|nr:MFS transporter [Pseudomonadales bacterium]
MTQALTPAQRIGYGAGDLGINLYFITTMTFLLYFYTDVFGLSPAVAGGVFLVARIVDAVTDPLMGMIAERTRSRWGRLRPYLLFGAVPMGIIAILTFTVPDLSDSGKIWWAYVTYVGFGIAYTVVGIPYSALTASLTRDHHERTLLSTIRMAFAFAGAYVVSVGMMPLVGRFETPAQGFQITMVLFALIATLLLCTTFVSTEERVRPPVDQRLSVADSLKAVFLNPPLMVLMVLFTGGMLSFTIRQTVTVYFFKYNLGREDLIPLFFGVTLPVMFVGLLAVPALARRVGKAGGIVVGALVTIAGSIGMFVTPYDQVPLIFFWACVMALGGTPIAVLGWAMIPDTVEYAQWRSGLRADGAIFSFASFFQKLAKALGGAGVAGVMALAGYVANVEQSGTSLSAIHLMMTLAPGAIMLVMILAAGFYRLDAKTHAQIVADLEARA